MKSMETFRLTNGKITATNFSNLTIGELLEGPYVLKFQCQGFNAPLYFAGHDDATWQRMAMDGKWAIHLATLIDNLLLTFYTYGNDYRDNIRSMKFSELNEKIKNFKLINTSEKNLDNILD